MLVKLRRHLFRGNKQLCRRIAMDDHIGERDWRMVDVFPANIEQPCNRIERGHDHGIKTIVAQPIGDLSALFG